MEGCINYATKYEYIPPTTLKDVYVIFNRKECSAIEFYRHLVESRSNFSSNIEPSYFEVIYIYRNTMAFVFPSKYWDNICR